MPDFWRSCGYSLLDRGPDGRLRVTNDYLRAYFNRPELAPIDTSCSDERSLHGQLLENPRARINEEQLRRISDEDARENYRVMLRFRDQLVAAPSLEAFYAQLFESDVSVPPLFIDLTVQAIMRSILDGTEDGLQARAGELFFRRQRVSVDDGAIRLADDQFVQSQASGGQLGDLGKLIRDVQPARSIELDVLDRPSADEYWRRDERFDTVLTLNRKHAGCAAFCRVMEAWIRHFQGIDVQIEPIAEIPDEEWVWHVGLDAEASVMLNEIYNEGEVDEKTMKRVIGLYRLEFKEPSDMLAQISGKPVFLGLATTPDNLVRMKPQNLLVNLPLARRT